MFSLLVLTMLLLVGRCAEAEADRERGGVCGALCVGLTVPLLARRCSFSLFKDDGVNGEDGSFTSGRNPPVLLRFSIKAAALRGTGDAAVTDVLLWLRTRRVEATECTTLVSTSCTLNEYVWFSGSLGGFRSLNGLFTLLVAVLTLVLRLSPGLLLPLLLEVLFESVLWPDLGWPVEGILFGERAAARG